MPDSPTDTFPAQKRGPAPAELAPAETAGQSAPISAANGQYAATLPSRRAGGIGGLALAAIIVGAVVLLGGAFGGGILVGTTINPAGNSGQSFRTGGAGGPGGGFRGPGQGGQGGQQGGQTLPGGQGPSNN
ncbi:MAG: hypothetical protein JWR53_1270 [Glaciihabitans sp.]|nr:hypothetical protein [Glaciihabitans sp.]